MSNVVFVEHDCIEDVVIEVEGAVIIVEIVEDNIVDLNFALIDVYEDLL